MTVGQWLVTAAQRLAASGVQAARLEAQLLAGTARGVDRPTLLAHPESPAYGAEQLLLRRLNGEPLAYILGYREFYGRRFAVSPAVLIPRQETEILVEVALGLATPVSKVLDVGVGSGCVAITLKLERPALRVDGVEISTEALAVARRNAESLDADVRFFESDLLASAAGGYDLIVSNPPYVREGDALPREVRNFEPSKALFAGPDGLLIYRRLAAEAGEYLLPEGRMALELGDGMATEVADVFTAADWRVRSVHRDLGGIERVIVVGR